MFTATTQQNVLAWVGNIQAVTCDHIGYHGNVPGNLLLIRIVLLFLIWFVNRLI